MNLKNWFEGNSHSYSFKPIFRRHPEKSGNVKQKKLDYRVKEKQGLIPDLTVIDGGKSARCGQKEAWPDVPAHGDTFHALKPFLELVIYLENRALDAFRGQLTKRKKLHAKRNLLLMLQTVNATKINFSITKLFN